jgi:hypothetical protein
VTLARGHLLVILRPYLHLLNFSLLLVSHRDIGQRRLQRIRCLTRELARRNLVLEEQIQLRVCKTLGLWKAEITPRNEKQRDTGPEETTLGAPVPVVLANHFRHDGVGDKDNRVVGCAGEGDGLDTEA